VDGDSAITELTGIIGPVRLNCSITSPVRPGDEVTLAARPESITLSETFEEGAIAGRLLRKIYLGNETDYRVALGNKEVRATAYTAADGFTEGSTVWMTFRKTMVMDR
jgi:ABC-type Fe3+/spermidine/putrescine transport system ATPase subunit